MTRRNLHLTKLFPTSNLHLYLTLCRLGTSQVACRSQGTTWTLLPDGVPPKGRVLELFDPLCTRVSSGPEHEPFGQRAKEIRSCCRVADRPAYCRGLSALLQRTSLSDTTPSVWPQIVANTYFDLGPYPRYCYHSRCFASSC